MEKIKFPEPDDILKEKPSIKKYFKYFLFFGPGAVIASVTIGQGQLILGPQIGAFAGYKLLWLITVSAGSYFLAYLSARFILLSGISMVDLFAVKTKKGFLNWIFIAIIFIFIPLFAATITTTLGRSLQWIFGVGHYLFWGISFSILAALLVVLGRYRIVEYTQAIFVAVLAIGAIISVIMIKPDLLDIIPNFFKIGYTPKQYPQWVLDYFESVGEKAKPIPLIMLGYVGTLTVTIITLVGYTGWVKIKKWGIFKDKDNPEEFSRNLFNIFKKEGKISYLPKEKEEVKKAGLLLKPIAIDITLAFIIVAVVSSAYMIAGANLLPQIKKLPTDYHLIEEQAIIFSNIAPWLKPLYQISVFFALFGTIYAGFEAVSRMLYETMSAVSKKIERIPYNKFTMYLLIYVLSTGIPLTILGAMGFSIILILSITLLFIGVIGVIIYGIGALYLSQKVLPREYRLSKAGLIAGIISIILFIIPLLML